MVAHIFLLSPKDAPEVVAMSGANGSCEHDLILFVRGERRKDGNGTDVAIFLPVTPDPRTDEYWDVWVAKIEDTPMLSLVGATLAQTSACTDLARAYQYLSKQAGSESLNAYRTLTTILTSLHEGVERGHEVSSELVDIQRWVLGNVPEDIVKAWGKDLGDRGLNAATSGRGGDEGELERAGGQLESA
ncbi:hypothetical protein C8Q76DRAFT_803433 [Earliella scabrosa]|nr:hypothetical protein C8Q76DRAFT_803433 [Earliella scabrosa]